MTPQDPRIGRIRWRGRRGMKELDSLFEHFFETKLTGCDDETLTAFERLLECQDIDLLDWLLGRSDPTDTQLKRIIDLIRGN